MQAIKCEICGSSDIVKKDGLFVCQHCSTKYTIDEARNLLSNVTINRSAEIENWKILAQRARFEGNAENAEKYYGLLNEYNPHDWEASFFHTYYQSINCKLADIPNAETKIVNALYSTVIMLAEDTAKMSEQDKNNYYVDAFKQLFNACSSFADTIVANAKKYRAESSNSSVAINSSNQWIASAMALIDVLRILSKEYIMHDPLYIGILDKDMDLHVSYGYVLNAETRYKTLQEIEEEINLTDPNHKIAEHKKVKNINPTNMYGKVITLFALGFGFLYLFTRGINIYNRAYLDSEKTEALISIFFSLVLAVIPLLLYIHQKMEIKREDAKKILQKKNITGKEVQLINMICDINFSLSEIGYNKDDVDEFLNQICDAIEKPDTNTITKGTITPQKFNKEKNGYSIKEVKDFLDKIVSILWP